MKKVLILGGLAALVAPAAQTAVISLSVATSGTDFHGVFHGGTAVPIDPGFLNFNISLDNTISVVNSVDGFSVTSTNLAGSYKYSYNPKWDFLSVSTNTSLDGCSYYPGDGCIFIQNLSSIPDLFLFVERGDDETYLANTRRLKVSPLSAVPEPAPWALMLCGFGAIGAAMRSRRKAAVSFA